MSAAKVTRHDARERAVALLFEADLRGRTPLDVLENHTSSDEPPPEFAAELVRGVTEHRRDLDALISLHSDEWRLERMPVVDRNVLRLAAWELLHSDVPTAVAINEAVTLVKALSTEDSGRFVNGVLARVAEARPSAGDEPGGHVHPA